MFEGFSFMVGCIKVVDWSLLIHFETSWYFAAFLKGGNGREKIDQYMRTKVL